MKNYKKFIICFSVLALFSSCNSTKIIYNYGDLLASWQLDKYFELTDEQEDWIEQRVEGHLQWHRSEELPKYLIFLQNIQQKASDGVSMQELDFAFARYNEFLYRSMERLIPDASLFLSQIDDSQIDHLEKKMLEENQQIEEDAKDKTPEDRFKKRRENFWEQMEEWFGEFNEQQRVQINEWHTEWWKQRQNPENNVLTRRKKIQPQFLTLLRTSTETAQIEQWLEAWTKNWRSETPSKKQARELINKQRIMQVDTILTQKQRHHAILALNSWIDIIRQTIPDH